MGASITSLLPGEITFHIGVVMKTSAKIKSLFPKKSSKTGLFQAHIDENILERVRVRRKLDGVSWKVLLETLFTIYLDEAEGLNKTKTR